MPDKEAVKQLVKKHPWLRKPMYTFTIITFALSGIATSLGHLKSIQEFLFKTVGPERLNSIHIGMEVVVAALFALGYALLAMVLYRKYMPKIKATSWRIAISAAMVLIFIALTVITVKAAIPTPPDLTVILKTTSEGWTKTLLGLKNADGGLRYHKSDPVESQVWTTAQILVGALADCTQITEDEGKAIRRNLDFIDSKKLKADDEGWGYFEYVEWDVSEINAWVALALISSLKNGCVEKTWPKDAEAGMNRTKAVLKLVTGRQLGNGGWAPIKDRANTRFARTYSAVVSLWALLDARAQLGTKEYDDYISLGIKWLMQNFEAEFGGWVPNPDRKQQLDSFQGLTAHVLYVLGKATPDFAHLLEGGGYQQALAMFSYWLKERPPALKKESIMARSVDNNDRSHDSDRYLPRTKYMVESNTFLWYPWTMVLCTQLEVRSTPVLEKPETWESCKSIYGRVNEQITFAHKDPYAYVMAESLYAINVYTATHPEKPKP